MELWALRKVKVNLVVFPHYPSTAYTYASHICYENKNEMKQQVLHESFRKSDILYHVTFRKDLFFIRQSDKKLV